MVYLIGNYKLKPYMISEFTHVMLKVCVKLAALSAEWPGRRKTYGPGEIRTQAASLTHTFNITWVNSHTIKLYCKQSMILYVSLRSQQDPKASNALRAQSFAKPKLHRFKFRDFFFFTF